MGSPLKAKYANTSYVDGVQEMSSTDIADLIVPLITQQLVDWSATPGDYDQGNYIGLETTVPPWAGYAGFPIVDTHGSITNISPVANSIGSHPTVNTSTTYTLYQNYDSFAYGEVGITENNRLLHTVNEGGVQRIQQMTVAEIRNTIIANVVSTMINGGQGAFWLGTSAPSDGGTWVVRGSVPDTYAGVSGTVTTTYNLYQKTTGPSPGTIRPLKAPLLDGKIQELTDNEIRALASYTRDYIRLTGIGRYHIGTSAPATGTWISRGSYVDTRNVLSDDPYSGSYLSNPGFTGFFTGGYSGAYTSSYQAEYVGYYTRFFTGTYEGSYSKVGVFSGSLTYTGVSFTGVFSGATSSTWTKSFSNEFTAVYVGSYSRLFTGSYEGAYTRFFTGTYDGTYTNFFSGVYAGSYTGLFTGAYTGIYTSAWASNFAGAYQNPFNAVYYAGSYAGTRNRSYTGVYGAYTGLGGFPQRPIAYASPSSTYTATFAGFSGVNYISNVYWTRSFTGLYGGYTGAGNIAYGADGRESIYSGVGSFSSPVVYTRSFTGTYGAYTGAGNIAYSSLVATGFFSGTFGNPLYSRAFSGFYQGGYASPSYTGTFNNFFGRVFTGVYGSYTGAGNIAYSNVDVPTGLYSRLVPSYTQTFSGNYTGIYSSTYVGPDPGGTYTGIYNNQIPFTRLFTGSYSGLTVSSSTVTTTYTLWVRTA